MGLTSLLTTASVVAAGAALGALALARPRRPVGVGAVALALAVAGALLGLVAAGLVVRSGGLAVFSVAHAAYLGVVVTLPLVGAGVLALGWRWGSAPWPRALAVALLVPAPVGAYATHVEPHWLRVDHLPVAVGVERAGDDPVRVAVLADLQTSGVGDHERRAVDEVLAAEPDLILLPGDLFQGSDAQLAATEDDLRHQLGRLRAPGGVFFVRGDVDGGGRADRLLAGTGVVVLDDEVVETRIGDRTVRIGGTRLRYDTPAADRVRAELEATPADGALTVLLGHRPDTVLHLPAGSRVDLTVAGHTHGGQVVVPGFGPLLTLSEVPRDVGRGGLHRVAGNQVYVSPGVGVERGDAPQVRLFNRPAVAVLTLADGP